MKKLGFITALIIGGLTFISCGSTAPCGLAQQKKVENKNTKAPTVLVCEIESDTNN